MPIQSAYRARNEWLIVRGAVVTLVAEGRTTIWVPDLEEVKWLFVASSGRSVDVGPSAGRLKVKQVRVSRAYLGFALGISSYSPSGPVRTPSK